MALTRRQREIYDYVCSFIAEHGYSPSLEEIGARFELASVATVHKHVAQLVAKGWLRKSWNRSRSLEPVGADPAGEGLTLPMLGVVAAGAPIEAIEVEERIAVPRELVRKPDTSFVLRVRGDSMIDEQPRDGDYVVVEAPRGARRETVRAGPRRGHAQKALPRARGCGSCRQRALSPMGSGARRGSAASSRSPARY
jgi:repressor LexA